MRIILASNNAGKLAEFRALFIGRPFALVAQSELGVAEVPETGLSFIENAILKARHAAQASGLPALADDSGLCVDALGGAPGLYSARYAGTHGDSAANIAKLLDAMRDVADENRGGRFVCALALLRHAGDPQPLIAQGVWEGWILPEPVGDGGFGYDPVFFDPAHGVSAAQLPPDVKNRIGHRGQAMQAMRREVGAVGYGLF